jgi:hypothetical protein
MEPKELAEKFKAKAAAKASKNEAAKVALELKRADAAKVEEEEAVKRAFELVVVPYLDECRATFPPNEFVFDTRLMRMMADLWEFPLRLERNPMSGLRAL